MSAQAARAPNGARAEARKPALLRPDVAARTWPSAVAALGAAAILAWMAFEAGGYFPTGFLPVGAVAWGLCAVLLAVRPPLYLVTTHALVGLGTLAALAAWMGLSATWSLNAPAGLEDMQRALSYLGLFALGLIAAGSGRLARAVVRLLGAVALAIVLAGVLHRLLPENADTVIPALYRLDHPLTYWNAYGALAALTAVLGVGLAADERARAWLRAVAAAGALIAAVGMYLSLSRGAWASLAVGLLVLAALRARKPGFIPALLIVGGLFTVAALRLRGYPALVEDPRAAPGQIDAGRSFALELLGLVIVAAGAQAGVALAAKHHAWRWQPTLRALRRLTPYAAASVVVLALLAYAAGGDRIESASVRAGDYVERQWDEFQRPAVGSEAGTARLATLQGTRSEVYRVAFADWKDHPIAGDGAGSFRVRWAREREFNEDLLNVHSLYLETLSDTGLVGLGLLGAFLGSLGVAASRSLRRSGGLTTGEAAAVTAACVVWATHSAVDWDWQVPALTGLVLVLAATLYPYGQRRRTSS